MKKKGFTLIEIIMVTAIMGIVMLMFSPMIDAFMGAQDRLYNQSKVDSRLNEVVEFIKRDVRNAKSDSNLGGEPVGVFDDTDTLINDGSIGKKVIIYTTDLSGNPKYVQYAIDGSDIKLKEGSSITSLGNNSTILSDVEVGEFKYQDKILLFHFKIDVPERLEGKVRNEVRDVGITRINLQ
ncbi:MAG: hypothetical protein B6227_03255 [Fusobacteriia bacterium 4572_74]|nr:MAG: hypothetical protein B6227_03255 [Fusobacteriia bacterium 4572_74]